MGILEPGAHPVRPSDLERERTIRALQGLSAEGRLSYDTFVGRVERALTTRSRDELVELVRDAPPRSRLAQRLIDSVAALSGFLAQLRAAWHRPRLPGLALPATGVDRFRVGREPHCDFRLSDSTVSRVHAELRREGDRWVIIDLGSTNGTRVNGWRVTGPTTVHPGDEITFGRVSFRLTVR
ncbi:hypothetical protein TH66_06405 [Carbonactinospora thermoautotrophica]|uniref:FHA domain-containing protein n=1 Tax=Carbonactinospora thermoautotrophica TaxID=1469144 RepID=A0A132N9Y1_9ACTN|nr:DUF1707 and FHA domain-containing protein [Carbonactinospora thermoautotrophica]KWX04794.1 hypothetical protein TH66_06405 [Carbonactinospora thermoautotrophica]KWX06806.1 hypothetical protein TR74_20825 [Carbonactinospora thermoautotrophica]